MFDVVAKRYAKALWELLEGDSSEQFVKELDALAQLIEGDEGLKTLAKSPIFSVEEKMNVFTQIFEKLSLSKKLVSFLNLLINKDRFSLIAAISQEFKELQLKASKTKEAVIETAFDLNDGQIKKITEVLEAALDTKIKASIRVNEMLLAGIVVHVDGRSVDASLRSNLNVLKGELLRAEA